MPTRGLTNVKIYSIMRMMEDIKTQQTKPFGIQEFFIRLGIALGSGFLGTIVMGLILLLSWSIVGDALSPKLSEVNEFGVQIVQDANHPLLLWIIFLAVFIGSMATTLSHTVLISLTEEVPWKKMTVYTQVFFGQLILLIPMLLLYMVANIRLGTDGIALAGFIHGLLSILFVYLIQRLYERSERVLVAIYGMVLGLILVATIMFLVSTANRAMLTFTTFPLLMLLIHMGSGIADILYLWVYNSSGSDPLSLSTQYGEDYNTDDKSSNKPSI